MPFHKKLFQTYKIESNLKDINLLYFENYDINPKSYFNNKQKKNLEQKNQILSIDKCNKNRVLNKINLDNSDNFFSFDLSDSNLKEDEETKRFRKKIIKDMKTKYDILNLLINCELFDVSQMMDDTNNSILKEENNKNKNHEYYDHQITNETNNEKNSQSKLINLKLLGKKGQRKRNERQGFFR